MDLIRFGLGLRAELEQGIPCVKPGKAFALLSCQTFTSVEGRTRAAPGEGKIARKKNCTSFFWPGS